MKPRSLLLASISLVGCVHSGSEKISQASSQPKVAVEKAALVSSSGKNQAIADDALPVTLPKSKESDCLALDSKITLPYYDPQTQLVLIGFLKSCTREDGTQGFVRGSSWTAMGFPCSQGKGRIEKKGGTENNPGMIRFSLPNACPMSPSSSLEAEQALRKSLGIPKDSHLLAYYPLSVDYWEFEQYPESDTGFTPEIYSTAALTKGWSKFTTNGESFKVKLFGRENAWERGKFIYQVDADLQPEGRHMFKLHVRRAEILNEEAAQKVKERCEAIRPPRNCASIFNWLP